MQKYDLNLFEKIFDRVRQINGKIFVIIDSKDLLENDDTNKINDLLNQREKFYIAISEFYEREDSKAFIAANQEFWNDNIELLKKNDEKIMAQLKHSVDSLAVKLKNLNKNKSLLVYLK